MIAEDEEDTGNEYLIAHAMYDYEVKLIFQSK
jgi:hypothetical protein